MVLSPAQAEFLAEKTVKNYVSALFAKLGMERRTQAAAYAVRVFGDQHQDDAAHVGRWPKREHAAVRTKVLHDVTFGS